MHADTSGPQRPCVSKTGCKDAISRITARGPANGIQPWWMRNRRHDGDDTSPTQAMTNHANRQTGGGGDEKDVEP